MLLLRIPKVEGGILISGVAMIVCMGLNWVQSRGNTSTNLKHKRVNKFLLVSKKKKSILWIFTLSCTVTDHIY